MSLNRVIVETTEFLISTVFWGKQKLKRIDSRTKVLVENEERLAGFLAIINYEQLSIVNYNNLLFYLNACPFAMA